MNSKANLYYTKTAVILHWIMAVAIIGLLLFGLQTMGNHNGRLLPTFHASAGFLLLALVIYRLIWRWINPPPPLPDGMTRGERILAKFSHIALYAAMILLPLSGWFAFTEHVRRSLGVAPASLFWMTKIPLLPDFGINFHFIHKWGGKAGLALIAIHVFAALKHHFFDRDDVLRRMIIWKQKSSSK